MERYTVGKLAERIGASPDTLRYYERIGLLPAADRTAAGYRLFDDGAVDRLQFIRGAQRLGLRLEEIGELLAIRERGLCPCGRTRQLLEERLAQLDAELAELGRLREEIRRMVEESPVEDTDSCSTLVQLGARSAKGGVK
jgi:DNA-binding transcriptional MerR regulator